MNKNSKKKIIMAALIFISISIFIYYSNNWIENTRYTLESPKVDAQIRIIHLSDLHGKQFGKDNKILIENIKNENTDIIVFTGDLIDADRNDNIEESVLFLSEISRYAPVYYIRGNHEYNSSKYEELMDLLYLAEGDVNILDGSYIKIEVKDEVINILGLDVLKEDEFGSFLAEDDYKIILNHYSENFSANANLSELDVDLVLTGHAHGGQWILPFIGGIYSPGQGFNPEYYEGMNVENESIQIISRGLGNSKFPIRLFNRPEMATIVIE